MGSLLSKNEYKFKNLRQEEYVDSKVFYFYCDNLQEGMHILFWLEEYNKEMKLIKRGYNGISNYISIYDIKGVKHTIIICSFYHNGELPRLVRQIIYKIDKPDVVIYSKNENKIVCGIENTETGFVGNATWQRHGRIMNFLENDFPFIFFAYYSKKDISQNTIRKPSPLLVLSFFSLSIEYSTPAILSLYDHEDITQNIINIDGSKMIDTRREALSYILSLIVYGQDSKEAQENLKKCFYDMKYYYKKEIERVKENELPLKTLKLLRKVDFENEIVEKIVKKDKNYPLFFHDISPWNPVSAKEFKINSKKVGIGEYIKNQLHDIEFYQLSPKCPVGITFDTPKLVDRLSEIKKTGDYFWEDSLNLNIPTIIILLKLTKKGKLALPDPYNGRIPAFHELYKQSFGEINCIIYLMDHSNENEYDSTYAKNMKIYKSINDYATIFVDRDLNVLDKNCDKAVKDSRKKYEEEITEDNVTCFFETILKMENIKPSFVNPPCGSWSDFKLYPTNKFFYLKRDDDRPDIAYYIPKNHQLYYNQGTYYVGESKASYLSFRNDERFNLEIGRINRLIEIIDKKIGINLKYKSFILFKGIAEMGLEIVRRVRSGDIKHVDYVVVIEEDNENVEYNIRMVVLEV